MDSELLPSSQNLVKSDCEAHKTQNVPVYPNHTQPPQRPYMNEELLDAGRFDKYRNAYDPNNSRQNDIQYWCSTCGTKMHNTKECPWLQKDHLRCRECES
jgi:DNA-directed RNA polymerase subunit RPC12/RpoP